MSLPIGRTIEGRPAGAFDKSNERLRSQFEQRVPKQLPNDLDRTEMGIVCTHCFGAMRGLSDGRCGCSLETCPHYIERDDRNVATGYEPANALMEARHRVKRTGVSLSVVQRRNLIALGFAPEQVDGLCKVAKVCPIAKMVTPISFCVDRELMDRAIEKAIQRCADESGFLDESAAEQVAQEVADRIEEFCQVNVGPMRAEATETPE